MAFITSPRGIPIYLDEAHSFLPWRAYYRVTPKQVYISTTDPHVTGMPQLDTLYHHATNCISPLTPEECFIFLTDVENNPSEFFTKLHQNTCEIMGVNKDFSKLETITPYLPLAYTFPQTTIAELENSFKQIKSSKGETKAMSSNKIAILIEESQLHSLQALGVKLEVIQIPNVEALQEKIFYSS